MITAVDTSVLLDVLRADAQFGERSLAALDRALGEGSLIACDVVWAETAGAFPTREAMSEAMDRLGVAFSALPEIAAAEAGVAWRAYRRRGGKRTRVVADFLIGAHAWLGADRLLTRDRGFYRSYFADLILLDPAHLN